MQTVKHIIDLLADLVQDNDFDVWTESDWIDNYNLQALKIIAELPDANCITEAIKLAKGSRQVIPSPGIALASVLMNMGTDGETPGTAINKADLGTIGLYDRNWRTATEDDEILNFMPDEGDPRAFYTYPPADGTSYVLAEFVAEHEQVVYDADGDWESAAVAIASKYIPKLMELMREHAYKKDTDIPGNFERESDAKADSQQV